MVAWQTCFMFVGLVTLMFMGLVNVNVGGCGQGLYKVKVSGFESVCGTEMGE